MRCCPLILAGILASALVHAAEVSLPTALSTTNRILVQSVVRNPTLQRTYPPRQVVGRADHFAFFLDHIDACSVLAEHAGLLNYRALTLPDGRLYASNTVQAAGYLAMVGCTKGKRLFYVEGAQQGQIVARGRAVVLVEFAPVSPTEFEYSGKLFVKVDNPVSAALAKMFFLFLKNAMDRNFDHVMRQPVVLTEWATSNPSSLHSLIGGMPAEDYLLLEPFQRLLPPPPQ